MKYIFHRLAAWIDHPDFGLFFLGVVVAASILVPCAIVAWLLH